MSSKLNILAADPGVMSFLRGKPGEKVVSVDLTSVEPCTLAHFSACPNYLRIYGPGASPNHDMYVYVGMAIPEYRRLFEPYYDINAPTKEGIQHIKKVYKSERQVCKVFHLASGYGASPFMIQSILEKNGIILPIKDVEIMHRAYWKLFSAVKDYTRQLQYEWRRNGGYIITGRGTPKPLDQQAASKDILNRMIQTTAHQYMMRWLWHIQNVRREYKIIARPLLPDLHDSTTWACTEDDVPKVDFMLQEGLVRLNEELNLTVVLKGATKIGDTMEIIT